MTNSEKLLVSVITPPSRVGGRICRVVKSADGGGKVESWVNGAWVPGGTTLKEAAMGARCADPECYAEGIAFARNASPGALEKIARVLLELLKQPSTCTALAILVLGIVTLFFSLGREFTALPW